MSQMKFWSGLSQNAGESAVFKQSGSMAQSILIKQAGNALPALNWGIDAHHAIPGD
jgi:hypothetical protein